MRLFIITSLFALTCCSVSFSQDYYNLFLKNNSNSVYIKTSKVNGDTLLVGGVISGTTEDAFLISINLISEQIDWIVNSSDPFNQSFHAIDCKDNDIIVGGKTTIPMGGVPKAKLLRFDNAGNLIWEKTYDAGLVTYLKILSNNSILALMDNGTVANVDMNGNLIWSNTFTNSGIATYWSFDELQGGIVVCGYGTDSPGVYGGSDIIAIKMDYSGNVIWSKIYGTSRDEAGLNCKVISNDKILIIGMHDDIAVGLDYDNLFLMIDTNGAVIQTETYGTNYEDFSYDLTTNSDGEIITAGKSYLAGSNDQGMSLKLDSNLNLVWATIYTGIYGEYFEEIENYKDGYILAGFNQSSNGPGIFQYEGWITRTTQLGYDGCLGNYSVLNHESPIISSSDLILTFGSLSEINIPMTIGTTVMDIDTGCFNSCNFSFSTISYATSCHGETDGAIKIIPDGYAGSFSFQVTPIIGNSNGVDSIFNLPPGNYQITVRDSIGCVSNELVTVIEADELMANFVIVPNTANAVQDCNGSISVTATGGTPAYTYLWDASGGNSTSNFIDKLCDDNFCIEITDANGCILDTCTSVTVGIEAYMNNSNLISLYPNPVLDFLTITLEELGGEATIEITDVMGRVVLNRKVQELSNTTSINIDLTNYSEGTYFVKIIVPNFNPTTYQIIKG